MKNIVVILILLASPLLSHAAQNGETMCGQIQKSRYCRAGNCLPYQYELSVPAPSIPDRLSLANSADFLSTLDPVANTGTTVCLTGYAFALAESSPGDFHLISVLSGSQQPVQTQVSGFLRRTQDNHYLLEVVTDSPLCKTPELVQANLNFCSRGKEIALSIDVAKFIITSAGDSFDPVNFEAVNMLVQLTGDLEGNGTLDVNGVLVLNN